MEAEILIPGVIKCDNQLYYYSTIRIIQECIRYGVSTEVIEAITQSLMSIAHEANKIS